jgi:D-arabinose 1-dehydrogenase-like Zn-dependent alcohol dehydrogenase
MGAYATTTSELEEAFRLIRAGAVRPWVTEVMALREAAEAHRLLEQRRVTGRLVLRPED